MANELSADQKRKSDEYFDSMNEIMEQPGFGKFLQNPYFWFLAQNVVAYAAHAQNKFTKRTGLPGTKSHFFFLIALGIWLGRKGVLRELK